MSWAQITMQASSSEEDVRATTTRQSRQNKDKRPIVIIASPHPTMLTGNYDSASPVQMGASMMSTPSGGRAQATSSATMFITGAAPTPPPATIPVQQTASGSLVLTAGIQMTSPSTTLLQSFPAGSKISGGMSPAGTPAQRSPATSRKGSGFTLLQADIESQDSGSRSSGSLTAIAITDLSESQRKAKKKAKGRGSRNKLKRKSSKPDDALARAFVEALSQACSPASSPSASSLAGSQSLSSGSLTGLDQLLGAGATRRPSKKQVRRKVTRRRSSTRTTRRRVSNADNALTQAVAATLSGTSSTAGGLGTTPSMSALITATSTGALPQGTPAPQGAGQMNFVLNIPNANSQDPSLNTLTLTIVQDPNAAAQAARRR